MNAVRSLGARLATLRPADLFSLPVLLGTILEFGLGQLASPYNAGVDLPLAGLVQVLTVGVAFAFLGIVYLLVRGRMPDPTVRTVLLVCIPIGALLGGLFLGWSRLSLGLDTTSLLALRMSTSLMHITAMTVLLWLAVSGIRLHYERLDALAQERDRLEAIDRQAVEALGRLDAEATEAVRTRILEGLVLRDSSGAQGVLVALTSTLEDIVRPLSRQLESQSQGWVPPPPAVTREQRIDWKAAALDGMDLRLLSPFWIVVILNLFAGPMNLARAGALLAAQFVLVSFCIAWPAFLLIRRAVLRRSSGSGARRIAAFLMTCVVLGLVLGAAMLPFTLGNPQPLRFVYLAPIFAVATAFVWGFAVAAQRQAISAEEALRALTLDLQWHIVRCRELHRQRCRALAHAVHGQVQAALAAGILEIGAASRAGTATDEYVRDVHLRIVNGVEQLDLQHAEPSPLPVVLGKVEATWTGLVRVSTDIDPCLVVALETDPQLLMTLNDVIPELTFNSVKHGRANEIHVGIVRIDERTVRLEVSDNGRSLADGVGDGMGSRLLEESTIEWRRQRDGDLTVTTVVLPFAPTPPLGSADRLGAVVWTMAGH